MSTPIGTVIQPGESIPEDVTGVRDRVDDVWELTSTPPREWTCTRYRGEPYAWNAGISGESLSSAWGRLTVTAVREQPAEPEPPRVPGMTFREQREAYEAAQQPVAEPQSSDLLDLVRQYGDERENIGGATPNRGELQREMANAAAREANALFARIEAEVQRLRGEVLWLKSDIDRLGQLRAADEAEIERLQAAAPGRTEQARDYYGVPLWIHGCGNVRRNRKQPGGDTRCDCFQRADSWRPLLVATDPGPAAPVVLSLPQVPEGAVALVGKTTRVRYDRETTSPVTWRIPGDRDALTLLEVFQDSGPELEVEMAPPREPRTWPRLDAPSSKEVRIVQGQRHLWRRGDGTSTRLNLWCWEDSAGVLHGFHPFTEVQRIDGPLTEVFDDEAGTR